MPTRDFTGVFCTDILFSLKDQAVKAAEAIEMEAEVKRLRDENAELRRRTGEVASLESAKRKAEAKVEQLEQKVRIMMTGWMENTYSI
jgi:homeobox protein cut-like